MSEPHRNILSVGRLRLDSDDNGTVARAGTDNLEQLERVFAATRADALLLEWEMETGTDMAAHRAPRGLYAALGAAARQQRVVFPARWLHVRSEGSGPGSAARFLAFARNDAALQRLFAEVEPSLARRGLSRPDEPLVLLGIEGDALMEEGGSASRDLRRRAEQWISRLGADRIVLACPADALAGHPLVELARQRALPLLRAGDPLEIESRGEISADLPLLWTDFQLDTEHRLPNDACIPGLRDLLHRGALLRERTLYDRLPTAWRTRVDAELRALYAWHVSPLLRRVSAGLQLLDAVDGVRIDAPLPHLRSVSAWLLGLTDQRPHPDVLVAEDPVSSARRLATALQEFNRQLRVRVDESDWPRLHARLATWAEGGFLARTPRVAGAAPQEGIESISFCFSGTALTHRTPLRRGMDGIDVVELDRADLEQLGWLRIQCIVEHSLRPARPVLRPGVTLSESSADIVPASFRRSHPDVPAQMALELGEPPSRQERSA